MLPLSAIHVVQSHRDIVLDTACSQAKIVLGCAMHDASWKHASTCKQKKSRSCVVAALQLLVFAFFITPECFLDRLDLRYTFPRIH